MFQFRLNFGGKVSVVERVPLDRTALVATLQRWNLIDWALRIEELCAERYVANQHGLHNAWLDAYHQLPSPQNCAISLNCDAVTVTCATGCFDSNAVKTALMAFHPWRKGPFELFDIRIDTEWRSDWKWDRVAEAIDVRGKRVLDVGSGNGYYGWRMLGSGATFVLGCDPFILYNLQYEVIRRYASDERHFVVPLADTDLPHTPAFDTVFSMGVLYHRTSPIDHLRTLHATLHSDGELVLETLIIDDKSEHVLVPTDRYAKMRNVWFIPSLPMLKLWLRRSGFRHIEVIDVSTTTIDEQRSTSWMTYESLRDFLDPHDATRTIEGYPAPRRAIVRASKGTS